MSSVIIIYIYKSRVEVGGVEPPNKTIIYSLILTYYDLHPCAYTSVIPAVFTDGRIENKT